MTILNLLPDEIMDTHTIVLTKLVFMNATKVAMTFLVTERPAGSTEGPLSAYGWINCFY
jgi:hypothetical protein